MSIHHQRGRRNILRGLEEYFVVHPNRLLYPYTVPFVMIFPSHKKEYLKVNLYIRNWLKSCTFSIFAVDYLSVDKKLQKNRFV